MQVVVVGRGAILHQVTCCEMFDCGAIPACYHQFLLGEVLEIVSGSIFDYSWFWTMPVKQWDDVSLIKSYILHPHGSNSIRLDQDENDGPDTICGLGQTHERGIRR